MFRFYKCKSESGFYIVGNTDDIKHLVESWRRSKGSCKYFCFCEFPIFSKTKEVSVLFVNDKGGYQLVCQDSFLKDLFDRELIECRKEEVLCSNSINL